MHKLTRIAISAHMLLAGPAMAQAPTAAPTAPVGSTATAETLRARAADVVAMLQGRMASERVFSPAFRAAVPDEQMAALLAQTTGQFGPIERLDSATPTGPAAADITIRYARALAHGAIVIEPASPNLVTGFRLTSFDPVGDTAASVDAALAALPGQTAALLLPLDLAAPPLLARNADRRLAIGSSFKLWVLHALARQVESGQRSWADTITIDRKSFASGTLYAWPDGAPITIQTAATLMISESDNTATDLLVRLVGQDALARALRDTGHSDPAANAPFLTTRELYQIKADPAAMRAWAGQDADARRTVLAGLDQRREALTDLSIFDAAPLAIDSVEWFASPHDIARVFDALRQAPDPTVRRILGVSPGLGEGPRARFAYVGYKGGSEPGVLAYNWLVRDGAGQWFVASVMWNDPLAPVDDKRLELIAGRLLALARSAPAR